MNTAFSTNANHTPEKATMKKINTSPVKRNTSGSPFLEPLVN